MLSLTLWTSTFEAVGSRAVPPDKHDTLDKIEIQGLARESSDKHRTILSADQLISSMVGMCAASSAVRDLAERTEPQVKPCVGHSLVWQDSPKGTARAFLTRKETECTSLLVASLPGSSPHPTRAP